MSWCFAGSQPGLATVMLLWIAIVFREVLGKERGFVNDSEWDLLISFLLCISGHTPLYINMYLVLSNQ